MNKIIVLILFCLTLACCAGAESVTIVNPYAEREVIAAERQAAALEAMSVQISSMNVILRNISETQNSYMITIPQVSYTLNTSSPIPVQIINDFEVVNSTR